MAGVPDVHDLLRWANRSEVAREITRRGYRVSVETLNRWHRDRKEVPAVVERIVFELFGVGQQETPPPKWAEGFEARIDLALWRLGVSPEEQEAALMAMRARAEWSPPPEGADGSGEGAARDTTPRGGRSPRLDRPGQ